MTLSHAPTHDRSPATPAAPLRRAVFVDPASRHLLALAQRVSVADVTTLLVGPTGAGKEVMARVLHESSARRHGPFVAINCAVLPEQLIESQLFGHEKGAFTGATRAHKGLFEQADGGTLFLDEIGEMPFHLQAKLLRVLQERQVVRLGSEAAVPVNVRLVAATNKDLRAAIAAREFREDLYYRIATFRLRLLPLAERTGDILPLALQFLSRHPAPGGEWQVTPEAQQMLLQYPWPGNVRELENVMRRAVVISADGRVGPAQLMFDDWLEPAQAAPVAPAMPAVPAMPVPAAGAAAVIAPYPAAASFAALAPVAAAASAQPAAIDTASQAAAHAEEAGAPAAPPTDLQSATRHNEHRIIMATLAATASRNEAAQRLGISPRTLRYKLAQLRAQGLGLPGELQGSAA
ncbi:sigma-54 interaction domain-containing protein [Ramlibacter sp. MAHUQ-53]|uniref:sigma-54 interaction domain-containing protein n=1 Tax=unclassified Ramlibacter TaxID=2617605 RepID=UPI0036260A1E